MKINIDKLLKYNWGSPILDNVWGLHLGKTSREKEYIVIMSLIKKNGGYPTSKVDETLTKSKIMEVVE